MYKVMRKQANHDRNRAGCGTTTTAYTTVWMRRPMAAVRIRLVASSAFGSVSTYSRATARNGKMFSRSLRWARRVRSMLGSSYFTLALPRPSRSSELANVYVWIEY